MMFSRYFSLSNPGIVALAKSANLALVCTGDSFEVGYPLREREVSFSENETQGNANANSPHRRNLVDYQSIQRRTFETIRRL